MTPLWSLHLVKSTGKKGTASQRAQQWMCHNLSYFFNAGAKNQVSSEMQVPQRCRTLKGKSWQDIFFVEQASSEEIGLINLETRSWFWSILVEYISASADTQGKVTVQDRYKDLPLLKSINKVTIWLGLFTEIQFQSFRQISKWEKVGGKKKQITKLHDTTHFL